MSLCFAACGGGEPPAPATTEGAPPAAAGGEPSAVGAPATAPYPALPSDPASWRGDLPCADCSGIRTVVSLHADGTYRRSDAYLGLVPESDTLFGFFGRWHWTGETGVLALLGDGSGTQHFALEPEGTLTARDRAGRPLDSELPYTLRPVPVSGHEGDPLRLEGAFSYFADAALFVTCADGVQLPVAMEGAYLELERAYGVSGTVGPDPMPLRVRGRVETRRAVDRDGTERVLLVDGHDLDVGPCYALDVRDALAAQPWRLTALDGLPLEAFLGRDAAATPRGAAPERTSPGGEHITPPALAEIPTFVWNPSESRISGSAGCNRFTGRGVLRGTSLVGGPLAATRRLCEGSMELEARYLAALEHGGWWQLEDDDMVLRSGPEERARFVRHRLP